MSRRGGDQNRASAGRFSRREFLRAGSAASLGLALPAILEKACGAAGRPDLNCIMLFLVGGPSHIDTWDPKPDAPEEIRGLFKPICTNVPGIRISQLFPRMAEHADRYSLIRSVHHTAAAIHETGQQMMQTGKLFGSDIEYPHLGSSLGYLRGRRGNMPAHVLTPCPMGRTGGNLPHGQTAGFLGTSHDPVVVDAEPGSNAWRINNEHEGIRDRYGRTRFGQSCLLARRLIEDGVRFVTVNMFETVFDEITWDIHGSRPFSDMNDMANLVAPTFDQGFTALLQDLSERGLLDTTVVAAMGEFGRTPKINPAGGRDHHPGVWTILMAGGPIKGGRVVGESDKLGYAPKSRPVRPAEVVATICEAVGMDCHSNIPASRQRAIPIVDDEILPVKELF
jgi:Protein of unknown function (DUF1501)